MEVSRECRGEALLRCRAKILRWPRRLHQSCWSLLDLSCTHWIMCWQSEFTKGLKKMFLEILKVSLTFSLPWVGSWFIQRLITPFSTLSYTHICRILTLGSLSSTPPNSSQLPGHTSLFHSARSSNPALLANDTKKLSPAEACASSLFILYISTQVTIQKKCPKRNSNQLFHCIHISSFPQFKISLS